MSVTELRRPAVNEELVRELEEMLERARSGELVAAAMACVITGRGISTFWVEQRDPDSDIHRLTGAVSHLLHRMHAACGGCEG